VYTEEETSKPLADFEGDTEICINIKREQRETQIEFVEKLYNVVLDLVTGKKDINQQLYTLLRFRIDYLTCRNYFLKGLLSVDNKISLVTPPTSEPLLNWLMQGKIFSPEAIQRQAELRLSAVTRFEMLNLLIKETFSYCNVDELQPETINLLKTSVQLHPILAGIRQDLGHPDEACSYYGILQHILLPTDVTHNNFPTLVSLKNNLELNMQKIEIYKNPNEYNLHFLIYLINNIKIDKNTNIALRDELLSIQRNMDFYVNKAHFKKFIPFMGLGVPKGQGIFMYDYTDTKEHSKKWPYQLPKPDFLKVSSSIRPELLTHPYTTTEKIKKNKKNHTASHKKEAKHRKRTVKTIQSPLNSNDAKIDLVEEVILNTIEKQKERENLEKEIKIEEQEGQVEVISPTVPAKEEKGKERIKEIEEIEEEIEEEINTEQQPTLLNLTYQQTQPYAREEEEKSWSFERDWELPRGLRIFHHQMLRKSYPAHPARNSNHQHVVDRLFNIEQRCTVTFKEFETLWNSEGGKIIENKGGSHKDLIDPQGAKLFGIFAHGNQAYGENYVKYLQTAVLYIGLRPSYLLSNLYRPNHTQPSLN
jgi:hypothetical protein